MNIYLTYDYELFFGAPSGSAKKCIIEPTNRLREIAKKTGAKMVFFIDVGYLKQLRKHQHIPQLIDDYQQVISQIKSLVQEGHDCQLHIHPHWEDTVHNGQEWKMNVNRYKLTDFIDTDILKIVLEYQSILKEITQKPVEVYRAGGWCLQPFSKVLPAFKAAGLKLDSTVFKGGKNVKSPYHYDFTDVPIADFWRFSNDLCHEDEQGEFLEFPISSYSYTKRFFWRLFILGRLLPSKHKPIGDGYPVPSVGMRKEMLTKGKHLSASSDGYFVTKLNAVIKQNLQLGFNHTVIIGHPKASTPFALNKLNKFIKYQINNGNVFCTLSSKI